MADLHAGPTYPGLAVRALGRFRDRIAFVSDGQEVTYGACLARCYQIARVLASRGLTHGDGVALLTGNRYEAFLVMIAAQLLGCRTTSLHPMASLNDHAAICEDAQIKLLAYDPVEHEERAAHLSDAVTADVVSLGGSSIGEDLLAQAAIQPDTPMAVAAREDDLAALPYTGGTTGRSKGVMHAHRALVHNAYLSLSEWQLPHTPRFLACTPISHGAGLVILPTLLRGGSVVLERGFSPDGFLATVEHHRVNTTFMVPTMVYMLLDELATSPVDVSSLETVIYGASAMSPTRLREALDALGPVFMQLYAQTEAPNTVTALRKEEHSPARPELLASCGRPLAGVEVSLRTETGQLADDGEVGEICVRGRIVMDGYWRQPEATADALRDGWLHTGDMARRDEEGFLYIVDRKKDMIVTGGFNVYPREIEDVLTAHPDVAMAAVIGVPDDKWGEAVKAVIVPREGSQLDHDALIEFVRERKGAVQAPKSVDVVATLPLTGLGKPDKKQLRATYWESADRQVN